MIVIKFALLMGIIGVITEEGHFKASSLLTVPLCFCFFYILTLFLGGGSYLSSMVPYLAIPPTQCNYQLMHVFIFLLSF